MRKMKRKSIIAGACAIAVGLAVALVACGGANEMPAISNSAGSSGEAAPGYQDTSREKSEALAPIAGVDISGSGAAASDQSSLAPSDQDLFSRKIIQNSSIDLQVQDVTKAYDEVERIAIVAGGYLADASVYSTENKPSATLTIRVPTDQYQKVMDGLRGLAIKVESETSKADDITDQYTDLQARLRSAQALEVTYLGLLDKAQTIDDILKIQDYLAPIRTEIEQIQGQLQAWDKLSSLATIAVSLHSAPATPVPSTNVHPNPLKAAGAGWDSSLLFLRAVGAGLFAAITFLWWTLPILAIVGIGFAVRYRARRRPGGTS
jgi:hypothetical protein